MALLNLLEGKRVVVTASLLATLLPLLQARQGPRKAITYDVTGISPQSRTLAQLSKGFASRGTLYPPEEIQYSFLLSLASLSYH